ncbi:hypothetical protein HanPSC8_Chr06g0234591 [Helianthus annuus]|nr:hypothetical protein HanPSC8_Chr06g0234591 [Helianthus annuus]
MECTSKRDLIKQKLFLNGDFLFTLVTWLKTYISNCQPTSKGKQFFEKMIVKVQCVPAKHRSSRTVLRHTVTRRRMCV